MRNQSILIRRKGTAMLHEVLTESMLLPRLVADSPAQIIDRLLDRLCETGNVKDRDRALHDILDNEARMSTGMQHGIAIPHAKSEAVESLLAAVATTAHPLALPDGTQAEIFILILSPREGAGPHVRFLAEIGRLLRNRSIRRALLEAATPADMRAILAPPGGA